MKTWDVIIAGAGIIGVSLALELRERGADVLILERGEPGREASSAAAGMLAAADPETPGPLRALADESARLWPEFARKLEARSGVSVDFRSQGTIVLRPDSSPPPGHKPLSSGELRELEPKLQAGHRFAFFLEENSVDPELLMRAAIGAARNVGIEIRSQVDVKKVAVKDAAIEVLAQHGRFLAGAAVNCLGAWAGLPVRPRKGQMLYLQPPAKDLLAHVVRAGVYLAPRSAGKILAGATVEDAGFDKTVFPETIQRLQRAAAELLPGLDRAPVLQSWAGLRPGSPDDLPILGETAAPGIYIAGGHFRNGILLAPASARAMAGLIMRKPGETSIAAFSPARFGPIFWPDPGP